MVDALVRGASGRKAVEVQVLFRAPDSSKKTFWKKVFFLSKTLWSFLLWEPARPKAKNGRFLFLRVVVSNI